MRLLNKPGADSGLVKLVVMTNVFFNTKSKLNGSYNDNV